MFIVQMHANTTFSDNIYILLRFMCHSHVTIHEKNNGLCRLENQKKKKKIKDSIANT